MGPEAGGAAGGSRAGDVLRQDKGAPPCPLLPAALLTAHSPMHPAGILPEFRAPPFSGPLSIGPAAIATAAIWGRLGEKVGVREARLTPPFGFRGSWVLCRNADPEAAEQEEDAGAAGRPILSSNVRRWERRTSHSPSRSLKTLRAAGAPHRSWRVGGGARRGSPRTASPRAEPSRHGAEQRP